MIIGNSEFGGGAVLLAARGDIRGSFTVGCPSGSNPVSISFVVRAGLTWLDRPSTRNGQALARLPCPDCPPGHSPGAGHDGAGDLVLSNALYSSAAMRGPICSQLLP